MILVTDGNAQYFMVGTILDDTQRTNSISSYPTVEGTAFTDHYYREPDTASFKMNSSIVSKPMVYSVVVGDDGSRTETSLSVQDLKTLVEKWYREATRLTITSMRHTFRNMVLRSYTWSEGDLALYCPSLNFLEARVQTLRTATIVNPEAYYQAAYGEVVSVGGQAAVQVKANLSDAVYAGIAGAGVAIAIACIPGVNIAVGAAALIGAGIGFFGTLLF